MKATIKLNLVSEVLKLAEIAQGVESDVLLKHGSYVIDATSILGIMSLNLSEPVVLEIVDKNESDANDIIKTLINSGFQVTII